MQSINTSSMLFAFILGIVSSVTTIYVKNWIDRKNAAKSSQKQLFKTLWKTRVQPLSTDHVTAINMIPLEFYGQTAITSQWKKYFEHLHQEIAKYPTGEAAWHEKRLELVYTLLAAIAKALKYQDIDEVEMKKVYSPYAHALMESDQIAIQTNLAAVLRGERRLPVDVHYPNNPTANISLQSPDLRVTGANSSMSTATVSNINTIP